MDDGKILRDENHLSYCMNCGQSVTMSNETWLRTFLDEIDRAMNCCCLSSYVWLFPGKRNFDRVAKAIKAAE